MREEQIDWTLTTWEGNRRQQHKDFQALSFREKLQVIEQLGEVASGYWRRIDELRQGLGVPEIEPMGGTLAEVEVEPNRRHP